MAPNDLTALIAGGLAGVAVIGLLLYYLRPVIASLRRLSGEQERQPAADPVPETAAADAAPATQAAVDGGSERTVARAMRNSTEPTAAGFSSNW